MTLGSGGVKAPGGLQDANQEWVEGLAVGLLSCGLIRGSSPDLEMSHHGLSLDFSTDMGQQK